MRVTYDRYQSISHPLTRSTPVTFSSENDVRLLTSPSPHRVRLQVMVVVKYLSQFGFFPWNSIYVMALNEDKPFFPPRILGLEKSDNYIRYDLLQLLALFFHRSLLMVSSLGGREQRQIEIGSSFSSREISQRRRSQKLLSDS